MEIITSRNNGDFIDFIVSKESSKYIKVLDIVKAYGYQYLVLKKKEADVFGCHCLTCCKHFLSCCNQNRIIPPEFDVFEKDLTEENIKFTEWDWQEKSMNGHIEKIYANAKSWLALQSNKKQILSCAFHAFYNEPDAIKCVTFDGLRTYYKEVYNIELVSVDIDCVLMKLTI